MFSEALLNAAVEIVDERSDTGVVLDARGVLDLCINPAPTDRWCSVLFHGFSCISVGCAIFRCFVLSRDTDVTASVVASKRS